MEIEEFVDDNINHTSHFDYKGKDLSKRGGNKHSTSVEMILIKNAIKNFDQELFEERKCTYMLLEGESLAQPAYICINCDPEKQEYMCKLCYEICHKSCAIKSNNSSGNSKSDPFFGVVDFICNCGKKNKHLILPNSNNRKSTCSLLNFDKKIQISSSFICKVCEVEICSICFYDCHNKCENKDKKEVMRKEDICECQHDNHSLMNEFTFNINPNEYFNHCGIEAVWPVHILNALFSSENIFSDLSEYILKCISNSKDENSRGIKFSMVINSFSQFFGTNFKTFYFHPKISTMFPYDKFVDFIFTDSREGFFLEDLILKLRMISVLLIVHVKKDFQMMKSFITSDFAKNSLTTRLLFRQFVNNKNIYNRLLHDKYMIVDKKSANKISVKDVVFKMNNLLISKVSDLELPIFQNDFIYLLEFISFLLKKMVFNKLELEKLINDLSELFNLFIFPLIEHNFEKINLEIIKQFCKIFFLISVQSNDLVVLNSIIDEDEKSEFIHVNSDFGNNIFKMLVQLSQGIIKLGDMNSNNSEDRNNRIILKIKKDFNEALKVFTLADNIYSRQLDMINSDDIKRIVEYKQQLLTIDNNFACDSKNPRNNTSLITNRDADEPENFFNLKMKIEKKIEDFFLLSEQTNSSRIIISYLENFSKNYDFSKHFFGKNSKNAKIRNTINSNNRNDSSKNRNNGNKNYKLELYQSKIKKVLKEKFPFLLDPDFNIENFLLELMYSDIDDTLTKFLRFFTLDMIHNTFVEFLLSESEIMLILLFLTLFFLTKTGLEYLCTGKNLSRIFEKSFFLKYPLLVMHFLYNLLKGLKVYEIDISNHKMIIAICERINENLDNIKNENTKEEHLMYSIKILEILSKFCEYDELEIIKKKFFAMIMNDEGVDFLNFDSFMNIFALKTTAIRFHNGNREADNRFRNEEIYQNTGDNNIRDADSNTLLLNRVKNTTNNSHNFHSKVKKRMTISIKDDASILSDNKMKMKLYFAFFNFISTHNFYIFTDDSQSTRIYKHILAFNNINRFKKLLSREVSLKHRIILLQYLRAVYFIDKLDRVDFNKRSTYMTKKEYKEFFLHTNSIKLIDDENVYRIREEQAKRINDVQEIIDIFIIELNNLDKHLEVDKDNYFVNLKRYAQELLLIIKYIFDFFYVEKNSYGSFNFYKLAKVFLLQSQLLKAIIIKSKDELLSNPGDIVSNNVDAENKNGIHHDFVEVDNNDDDDAKSFVSKYKSEDRARKVLNYMNRIEFNIYNNKNLYAYVIQIMNELLKETKLDKFFALSTTCKNFDRLAESNFFPTSLVETKDYEYFYENDHDEDIRIIHTEVDKNFEIFKKFEKIKENYYRQFINLKNTNFFAIIQIPPGESNLVDYRMSIVKYFYSYFTKNANNFDFKSDIAVGLLTIVTKLLYYDSEKTQKKFEDLLINDENITGVGDNCEYLFFDNFNRIINEIHVLNFSACKNFFSLRIGI